MAELLARFTIHYTHGVLVITDHDGSDAAPLWETEEQVASSSTSTVMLKVRNAVLGPVTTEVLAGYDTPRPSGTCCFDGVLALSHGRLRLGDADALNRIVVGADPGRLPVRVYVEPEQFSERVTVLIDC